LYRKRELEFVTKRGRGCSELGGRGKFSICREKKNFLSLVAKQERKKNTESSGRGKQEKEKL